MRALSFYIGRTTKFFGGRDAALRRPDGAARRPYQGNEDFCPAPFYISQNSPCFPPRNVVDYLMEAP